MKLKLGLLLVFFSVLTLDESVDGQRVQHKEYNLFLRRQHKQPEEIWSLESDYEYEDPEEQFFNLLQFKRIPSTTSQSPTTTTTDTEPTVTTSSPDTSSPDTTSPDTTSPESHESTTPESSSNESFTPSTERSIKEMLEDADEDKGSEGSKEFNEDSILYNKVIAVIPVRQNLLRNRAERKNINNQRQNRNSNMSSSHRRRTQRARRQRPHVRKYITGYGIFKKMIIKPKTRNNNKQRQKQRKNRVKYPHWQ